MQGILETRLSNGVCVVTEALPERRALTLGIWVDVGSRDEADEIQGCSHFIEHMLFKGTSKRSAEEISRTIEERGGYLNAFTDREYTCLMASVLQRDTELAIDVLTDMIQKPLLRDRDIELEKTVIFEEINRRDDSPENLIQDLFIESVWRGNPAAHPVLGNKDALKNLKKDAVVEYFKKYYVNGRIVIAAAGAVDHSSFVDELEKRIEKKDEGSFPKRLKPIYSPSITRHERTMNQVQLSLSAEGAPFEAEPSWYIMTLLNSYLGEGASSRLFQEVREKRGLVYSIQSTHMSLKDCGLFGIFAGTNKRKAGEVVDTVLKELEMIREGEVDAKIIEETKHKVEGMLTIQMESSRMRMYNLGSSKLRIGRVLTLNETIEKLSKVTVADLESLSQKILDEDRISFTALGLSAKDMMKIEDRLR